MADKLTVLPTRATPLEVLKEQVRLLEAQELPTPNEVVVIYEFVSPDGSGYAVAGTTNNAGTVWMLEAAKLAIIEGDSITE